jgi:hypothetical protein
MTTRQPASRVARAGRASVAGLGQVVVVFTTLRFLYGVFVRIPGCGDNFYDPDTSFRYRVGAALLGCGVIVLGGLLTYRAAGLRWSQAASVAFVATPLSLLALKFSELPASYLEPHLLTIWLLIPLAVVFLIRTDSERQA